MGKQSIETGLKRITGEKFKTIPCAQDDHNFCNGFIGYPGKALPPLLAFANPLIPKTMAAITFERSATITVAQRPNHELKMMCRCGCHLEKLLAEQERLAILLGAIEVGMPSEND